VAGSPARGVDAMTAGDGLTVLVADADEATRSRVRLTLQGESYTVVEAADTEAALRCVAASLPDLVLLDAGLPGGGGIAVTRSLKAQPETRPLPVVLLVDRSDPVDVDLAREAGAADVVAKPLNALALLKKVSALIT
jgi:CheY-like chemotaxis protein